MRKPWKLMATFRSKAAIRFATRGGFGSHFTPPRVIDGGRFTESLDGHPVGALAVLGLLTRAYTRCCDGGGASHRRAPEPRPPRQTRPRGRNGLSTGPQTHGDASGRLTPKSTRFTAASGTSRLRFSVRSCASPPADSPEALGARIASTSSVRPCRGHAAARRRQETRVVALVVDAPSVHRASDALLGTRRQTLGERRVLVDERIDRDVAEHELRQAELAIALGASHEPVHHRVAGPDVITRPQSVQRSRPRSIHGSWSHSGAFARVDGSRPRCSRARRADRGRRRRPARSPTRRWPA